MMASSNGIPRMDARYVIEGWYRDLPRLQLRFRPKPAKNDEKIARREYINLTHRNV